jgi:hypothetical protein
MATVFTAFVGFNGPNASVNSNRALLFDLLADSDLVGYTVTEGDGFYDGQPEPSAVVTVIGSTEEETLAYGEALIQACRTYKELACQAEVWITRREEDLLIV